MGVNGIQWIYWAIAAWLLLCPVLFLVLFLVGAVVRQHRREQALDRSLDELLKVAVNGDVRAAEDGSATAC